jgi:hypothetical protein
MKIQNNVDDLSTEELLIHMKQGLLSFRQQAYHLGSTLTREYNENWPDDMSSLYDDTTGENSFDDKIVRLIANIEQILSKKYLIS